MKTAHAAEPQCPDVLRRWRAGGDLQPDLDPERLVFIAETGASNKMARLWGRAPRGERCRAPVPHGHWKATTFVGGLGGMTAPMVRDGAMNGPAFVACVAQVRAPTLRPGDVVVMDDRPAPKLDGLEWVAAGPRFPIGYTERAIILARRLVAAGPRFPIGYTEGHDRQVVAFVAAGPRFPIGYTGGAIPGRWLSVAAGPRFPIGYTAAAGALAVATVAAGPRFPIGYT